MEDLKKARAPFLRHFNRMDDEINGMLQSSPIDVEKVTAKIRQFTDLFNHIAALNEDILKAMTTLNLGEDEEDKIFIETTEIKEKYELVRIRVERVLNDQFSAASDSFVVPNQPSINHSTARNFKLPKIELEKFTGDMKDWLRFWAQFEKIHEDLFMSGSDKFWYLLQSLQRGTEAYEIATAYPQSNDNYPKVIEALKKRFGNEDMLLQIYIRELLSLVISNVNSKEKTPLQTLFLKLDSYLRALKTLNLERADPATWLFPLVESSLPEEVLYNWQRSSLSSHDGSVDNPPRTRLDVLMEFIGKEVDIKHRMEITRSFTNNQRTVKSTVGLRQPTDKSGRDDKRRTTYAAVGLHVDEFNACAFCGKTNHRTRDCRKAMYDMTYDEKINILKKKGLCYNCCLPHRANECRNRKRIQCSTCGKSHCAVICRELRPVSKDTSKQTFKRPKVGEQETPKSGVDMSNTIASENVYLQTVQVKLVNGDREKIVRAFLDSGSSRSYILTSTAAELRLIPKSKERVVHSLFGGVKSQAVQHMKYDLLLKGVNNYSQINVDVRDQDRICNEIPRLEKLDEDTVRQLREKKIDLTDVGMGTPRIELLIGGDVYGRIMTGKKIDLRNGMVAFETILGWTCMGKLAEGQENGESVTSILMAVSDSSITNLWELEAIGIRDNELTQAQNEQFGSEKKAFLKQVRRSETGRYIVRLPRKTEHPVLPTNREVALRRLESTSRKLQKANLFRVYGELFRAWEEENFIEKAPANYKLGHVHYLPHRAVIKPGSATTPVRPVFDASCKSRGSPSLNDILQKGDNYIRLIPEVLICFREKRIGFTSDIRKAFQMIEVDEDDRDSLRFLWWKNDEMTEIIEYRHVRVPFGATCSPFILGAILEYHLTHLPEVDLEIGNKLLETLYVDNCCSSEDSVEEYIEFKNKAVNILEDAKMNLRMWLSNVEDLESNETRITTVLGMKWDRLEDALFVEMSGVTLPEKLTKRTVLSLASKVFDPIGFTSPAVLPLKIILQKAWINRMKWDEALPASEGNAVAAWINEAPVLEKIRIPRVMTGGISNRISWQLHTFNDSSGIAYGSVVYLRAEMNGVVSVQLLSAKSRVAPLKSLTIPRLELLACTIGTRLAKSVKGSLHLESVTEFYWTDSSTALAWIKRNDQWGTFVGRRTAEIVELTRKDDWHHVPGKHNPADLPSRGCTPAELMQSEWWKGPSWLYLSEENWPRSEPITDEEMITTERRKTVRQDICSLIVLDLDKQHKFRTLVRIQGWIRRFTFNCRPLNHECKKKGNLSAEEIEIAERDIILQIQQEAFDNCADDRLKGLECFKDEYGVLRVQTRLTYLKGFELFKYPAVLPGKHHVVRQLIQDTHIGFCHAGVGFLITALRKKYWIVKARQSIKHVVSKCYRCRRYSAKNVITETAPLPKERIEEAEVFEIVGVDLAGPFILKSQKKAWIVIYTCAVYRAVHLQVVDSLTTSSFIISLKRFVERFRRPRVIYSDNGTNFRGADKLFKSLNWEKIQKEKGVTQIVWKFNPATASWWGGWWERLIRTVKDLIRKATGGASLSRKELEIIVNEVGSIMNERPLTYVSEDINDLVPLTPSLFLHPFGGVQFPEGELTEGGKLRYRYQYMQTLKMELRSRFRKEYLAFFVSRNPKKTTRPLVVGELVFVGSDNKKRSQWPLGRVISLIPGNDGVNRVATVKTAEGVYTRPVQRLYPLEAEQADLTRNIKGALKSRFGRIIRPVNKSV